MGNDVSSRRSWVTRALTFLLTVGLGASLAIVGPRLWAGAAAAPRPTAPVITPLPIAPTPPAIEIHDIAIAGHRVSPKDGVTAVVMAGRHTIQKCAERALPRDLGDREATLTIRLNLGISGRVKHVFRPGRATDFGVLDPCIKEAVSHWQFPPENEEYWVEFTLALRAARTDLD